MSNDESVISVKKQLLHMDVKKIWLKSLLTDITKYMSTTHFGLQLLYEECKSNDIVVDHHSAQAHTVEIIAPHMLSYPCTKKVTQ